MSYELPFILYDNELEDGTLTVTSEESGFPKENLVDWLDWTYWKASSAAAQNIDVDKGAAGSSVEVDSLAILAHNLGTGGNSLGCDVTVQEDDNPSFSSPTTLGTVSPVDDDPFYLSLTAGTERYNRIKIENMEDPAYIGVGYLGKRMTMPVGPEFSFDPDRQETKSEKYVNYSGRLVGSAKKYDERIMEVDFRRIAQSFVASDLLPFLEDHYTAMKPFFFVPDPGNVFGTGKVYYLTAPDNPRVELSVYGDDISFRDWVLRARGIRQSTFR